MRCARILSVLMVAAIARPADAQRAPAVGTVSPRAVGPAIQQPAPIGGLRTTPLSGGSVQSPGTGRAVPYGWIGTRVIDAPVKPYGVSVDAADAPVMRPRFTPTYEPPHWVIDSTAEPSTLWRSLIVRDVVCDYAGTCLPRTSRVRAKWVARCDCYAFADGLGRVWRVGDR